MYLNTVVCLKNSVRLNSELLRTDIIAFWANPEMLHLPPGNMVWCWHWSINPFTGYYKPVASPPLKDPFFMGNKIMDLFMPSVYWAYAASTYTSTDKSVLCGWHGQYPINHFHFQGSFFSWYPSWLDQSGSPDQLSLFNSALLHIEAWIWSYHSVSWAAKLLTEATINFKVKQKTKWGIPVKGGEYS